MAIPSFRSAIKSALVAIAWLFFAAAYFTRLPIPAFPHLAFSTLIALLTFVAAFGYGKALQRFCIREPSIPLEPHETLWISAGFGVVSLLMFVFGLINAWTKIGALAILLIGLLLAWRPLRSILMVRSGLSFSDIADEPWAGVALAFAFVFSLLLAFAPITYYDSLVYHFAMPAAYVHARHWVRLPLLIYSGFPQNLEMLWTWGLLLYDQTVSNLIAWALSVLLIASVVQFGRRFLTARIGWCAAALLSLMPAVLLLSSGGYIDIGLTLFAFSSIYALFLWREEGLLGWAILGGILAGFAAGTKYTGVIPVVLGGLFLSIEAVRLGRQAVKVVGVYALALSLVLSPWLVKNWVQFGNPVFPFFYQKGAGPLNPWLSSAAAGYFKGLTEYHPRSFFSALSLLGESAIHGLDFGGGIDTLGDFGWAALVGLLPALWFCRSVGMTSGILGVYLALFLIPWGMSRPVLRFLLPAAPIIALLSARAWIDGVRLQANWIRWIARFFLGGLLTSGLLVLLAIVHVISPFEVLFSDQGRSSYLAKKLNYYPAALFLSAQRDVKSILVMGDQRGYYYEQPVTTTPVFADNPWVALGNESATPQAYAEALRNHGYSHLVVNHKEMKRLNSYGIFNFNSKGFANWNELQSGVARSIYRDPSCEVFAL